MKILLLPGVLNINYICWFARALSERGHSVIFCAFCDALTHRDTIESALKYLPPEAPKRFFPLHPWQFHPINAFRLLQALWFILCNRPQIVHVQDLDLGSFVVLLILSCIRPHLPVVATIHDITLHPGSERHFLYRNAQRYMKIRAKRLFIFEHPTGLPSALEKWRTKIVPIPLYLNFTMAYEPYRTPTLPEEDMILFFGWICVYKGIEYLMDAIEQCVKSFPSVKLIIAGMAGTTVDDQAYSDHLRLRAQDIPCCEAKIGYHTYEQTATFFKRAKIVVLPYIEASQSGVVSLACYFKKPVIATTVGHLPQQVINNHSGILVPPRDTAALTKAINALLTDDENRKRLGNQGHHDFTHDANSTKSLDIIVATYNQLI